jgi:hypothetical protein
MGGGRASLSLAASADVLFIGGGEPAMSFEFLT